MTAGWQCKQQQQTLVVAHARAWQTRIVSFDPNYFLLPSPGAAFPCCLTQLLLCFRCPLGPAVSLAPALVARQPSAPVAALSCAGCTLPYPPYAPTSPTKFLTDHPAPLSGTAIHPICLPCHACRLLCKSLQKACVRLVAPMVWSLPAGQVCVLLELQLLLCRGRQVG